MPNDLTVTVMLFAALRDRTGRPECAVSVPAGSVVADVWPHLPEQIRRPVAPVGVRYAVNDRWADPRRAVAGGDRIAVLMPFSGG